MIFFRRRPDYDPDKEMTLSLRFRIWTSGWRGIFVLFALVALGLGMWKGADAYEWLKAQRAEHLIAESEAARERGDFIEASKKLGEATALLQRHPLTLRAVARYQVAMRDLSALNTYVELMKTGQATTEDKIQFAREALRLGRPEMAAGVLAQLKELPDTRDTAAVLAIQAGNSAAEGRWPEAVEFARRACASPGSDTDLAFAQSILARLLIQPPSPTEAGGSALLTEGVDLLSALALRQDAAGIEALEILVSLSQNMQTATLMHHRDVKALTDAAERHPRADAALKVGAWSLLLAADPSKRVEITQALYEHFKDNPSSKLRLEAARWLNKRGMHRLTLELAEPSKRDSEDWFVLCLDATAALGNWEEVFRTLSDKDEKVPLPPALRKLFELRGALETGRRPDLIAAWRDIQGALRTESAGNQLYVAGYAEQIRFHHEAAIIYRRLLDRDESAVPAAGRLGRPRRMACFTGVLRTGAGTMTLEELRSFVGAFAAEFPEIDEVQNDNAYLQLLSGLNLDRAAAMGERLMKKKPDLLAYRTTVALSLLRRQKAAAAVAVYDGWRTDWSTAQDRYKAVYAAVMRAGGRASDADRMVAKIKSDSLRPEERQLAGLP